MTSFTIPGEPVAQGRPRFSTFNRFPVAIDPKESREFKSKAAFFAKQANFYRDDGPLKIVARFYFKRPKYADGKKFSTGAIACFRRPDIDNAIKCLFDGIRGIIYRDDSQVCKVLAMKFYHEAGGQPRTEVEVYEPVEEVKPHPAEQGLLFV
jgi:Holliday junction resolvase RusA-like endonuclease